MRLNGMVIDVVIGNFLDSVELQVIDLETPVGRKKKPHTLKIYEGVPGLDQLRKLVAEKKKQFGQGFDPRQDVECQQAAAQIQLPQAFTQCSFNVFDVSGKGNYINLVAQFA